ncbi:MAG: type 1 periplasmic binding fold superfamily protein [Saprospiraceae bacterium]|nr:type 1 periplasmic binding fold superfamily protein [Saprospiraceae bacterium]
MIRSYYLFIGILLISLSSCLKDPEVANEEELITTLKYKLTPVTGGNEVVMTFKDVDGTGGNAAQITGGTLLKNTAYTGVLELLNEQANPVVNITQEVQTEATDHQFFFSALNGLTTVVSYTDKDSNGNPLGILTSLNTGAVSSGKLRITLRHEPNKSAQGVKEGLITNAGGETDIEVEFPVNVN